MTKRILATFLWFNAGWVAGALATFVAGLPDGLSVVLALICAVVVWFDPAHVLWTALPTRQRVTAPETPARA